MGIEDGITDRGQADNEDETPDAGGRAEREGDRLDAEQSVESGAEKTNGIEVAAGETARIGQAIGRGAAELAEREKRAIKDLMAESELSAEEMAGSPDLERAAEELSEVARDADILTVMSKGRLGGLVSRLKKLGVAVAALGVLAGGLPAKEARAESPDQPVAAALEGKPPAPEMLMKEAVERISQDQSLRQEVGPEAFEKFKKAVERFDPVKVNSALAELGGGQVKASKEFPKEVAVLSVKENNERKKRGLPHISGGASGSAQGDRILLKASNMTGDSLSEEYLHSTLVHEQLHVATTPGEADEIAWGPDEASNSLYEGVTEVLAQRIAEKMGVKPDMQAYAGGDFAAAYLLERVVGTKDLASDYAEGKVDRIKATLDKKFGEAGTEAIMAKKFSSIQTMFGAPEGMVTAFEILRQCEKSGIDYGAFLDQAKKDGLREQMTVLPKAEGLFLGLEVEGKYNMKGVLEHGQADSPASPPMRVLLASGTGRSLSEIGKKAEILYMTTKDILERHHKYFVAESDKKDPEGAWQAQVRSSYRHFDLKIDIKPHLAELEKQYANAQTDAERQKLQVRMQEKATEVGRQALAKFAEEYRKLKAAKKAD